MKSWMWYVLCTIICWGAYVPILHHGQSAFGKNSALRAFLFVGAAYFLVAGSVLCYLLVSRVEPLKWTRDGVSLSTLAGFAGAVGALGVVFALKSKGNPLYVAPLVFAGAPIVNTVVAMLWDRPEKSPSPVFYLGIALAGVGAALVLRFKPT